MDTDLVTRAQGGDQEAFADLVYAIADRFLAVSHRILSDIDVAEDATQQALLDVWQDLPQLRDPARFEAWSYASTPMDVAVDGFSGKAITLNVPDDVVFSDCDQGEFRTLVEGEDSARYHQDPGQIDLVWVLDVNGELVIIDIAYYEGTPESVLDEAGAIVESATLDYSP
jgi:hypothetical protein